MDEPDRARWHCEYIFPVSNASDIFPIVHLSGPAEDPGEPHDEPSPFSASTDKADSASSTSASASNDAQQSVKQNVSYRSPRDKAWAERLDKQGVEEDKRLEEAQKHEKAFQDLMKRLRDGSGKK